MKNTKGLLYIACIILVICVIIYGMSKYRNMMYKDTYSYSFGFPTYGTYNYSNGDGPLKGGVMLFPPSFYEPDGNGIMWDYNWRPRYQYHFTPRIYSLYDTPFTPGPYEM